MNNTIDMVKAWNDLIRGCRRFEGCRQCPIVEQCREHFSKAPIFWGAIDPEEEFERKEQ